MVRAGRFGVSRSSDRPVAAVYRGPVACDGCAESVAALLRSSPLGYQVHYLGPHETNDVNSAMLSHLDLFAWPGGGDDVDEDFQTVKHYKQALRSYVAGGGRYLGICLGAFLARGQHDEFFGLLPSGSFVSSERFEPGAEVTSAQDTIIRVDWTWHSGNQTGQTSKHQWMYFQDGGVMSMKSDALQNSTVLGTYSANGDITAIISPYGKGQVGLIGTHPEADQSWYDDYKLTNPQNVSFAIGHDFIQALHDAGNTTNATSSTLMPGASQTASAHSLQIDSLIGLQFAFCAFIMQAIQHFRQSFR